MKVKSICGEVVAIGISWVKVSPVEVNRVTSCWLPSTHGYGIVIRLRPSRGMVLEEGSIENFQIASSTITWDTVTALGPPLVISKMMRCGLGSTARSIVNSSTGAKEDWKSPRGPYVKNTPSKRAKSTRGRSPQNQFFILAIHYLEQSHPSQFGKLTLMSVKHEFSSMLKPEFQQMTFPLAHHNGVSKFIRF